MNETIKDIVTEMREKTAKSRDEAWYDKEKWAELCNRIEAAHEREIYNTAQMFEALELASCVIHAAIAAGILKGDDAQNAFFACRAALSAPARNCDLYPTLSAALDAWREIDPREAGPFDNWLFAEVV